MHLDRAWLNLLYNVLCIALQYTVYSYTKRNVTKTDVPLGLPFTRRRGDIVGFQTRLESICQRTL